MFILKTSFFPMKGFCAVIEEGSINTASKKINTVSSNVNFQVSSLGRDLNLVLFKREKQRLLPTEEAFKTSFYTN